MQRFAGSLRHVFDVAVPAGVGLYEAALVLDRNRPDPSWLTLLGLLAAVATALALGWRRTFPVPVMLATLICGVVLQLLAPAAVFPVGALVAMWSLTVARPPLLSLPALLAVLGLTALAVRDVLIEDVWFGMAVAVAIWALAEAVRSRRRAIREASRRAVGDEQARIARELHDVIAHSVSVIVVQAAAADDVFDARPDQARSALRSIEAAGREALGELRHLLGAVSAPRPALPGLGRLAELTAPLREAGLEVAVHREGADGLNLPAGVDLSAYRIVQEALTNTLRHAGATRASVTIRTVGGVLELDVSDNGSAGSAGTAGTAGTAGDLAGTAGSTGDSAGSAGDLAGSAGSADSAGTVGTVGDLAGPGRGLAGMRERAAMLGGTFDAGPLPDGGFRVRARLPLEPAR